MMVASDALSGPSQWSLANDQVNLSWTPSTLGKTTREAPWTGNAGVGGGKGGGCGGGGEGGGRDGGAGGG